MLRRKDVLAVALAAAMAAVMYRMNFHTKKKCAQHCQEYSVVDCRS